MELQPIIPFEPVRTDLIPIGERWIAQVKWDGVRILTYHEDGQVRLFNRKLNERTIQYPEFTEVGRYCAANSVILDGEVIALHEGKPSFHEIMRRDGIRYKERVTWARETVPAVYMIFDILYRNEKWIIDQPLRERQEQLKEIIRPQHDVLLVENFADSQSLFYAIQREKMEGIICKDLDSTYKINAKDNRWQKYKNYRDLNVVVGGVTFQGSTVNAVLLGLYDQQRCLCFIGKAGTGKLTTADWQELTVAAKSIVTRECPFGENLKKIPGVVWLKPLITLKVQFIEWTDGGILRQPSIQAVIPVAPETCVFD